MEWTVPTVFSWVMLSVLLVIIWWYYSVATPPSLDHVNETVMKFLWSAVSHYTLCAVCAAGLCDRSHHVTKKLLVKVWHLPGQKSLEKYLWSFLFALRHRECDTWQPVHPGLSAPLVFCYHFCAPSGSRGPRGAHTCSMIGVVTPTTWPMSVRRLQCAARASISLTVLSAHRVCVLWNSSSFHISCTCKCVIFNPHVRWNHS